MRDCQQKRWIWFTSSNPVAEEKDVSVMERFQGPGRLVLAPGFLLAWTILLSCPSVLALNPALDVNQYAHTSWKIREGFTKGVISSIAQTPDGYLWLGTEFGLVRFDGVKAVPWQPPAGQHLPSNRIFSLLGARDGTLWIGTSKGLASWKGGKLTQYPELDGQAIRATILEDHDGVVWVGGLGSSPPGKLCAIQNGSVQCYGEDDVLDNGVSGLYEDSNHNLWVGVRNGLWRWKPGPPKFYPDAGPAANGGGIQGLAESDDAALLFGPLTGISKLVGDKTEEFPLPRPVRDFTTLRLLRDRDGNLWIGTSDGGLVHVHRGRTDVFAQADGLSGDFITALFVDREDTIWVATGAGLDHFREFAVPTLSLSQGLSNSSILSVLADRDGSIWLSTRRGLNRWNNGEITIFGKRGAEVAQSGHGTTGSNKQEGLLNGAYAGSIFQDSRGRVWASTLREFGYLENDRFVPITNIPGGAVYSISEDVAGTLWIANKDVGLIQLFRDGRVQQIPLAALGHKDPVMAFAHDSLQAGQWLGFRNGGVVYLSDGQVRATYAAADGLGEGRVNDLRFDTNGTLWAGTEGGLSRLKNGRVATLTSKNGLPCDGVHWVMEDNDNAFWLYTTCGLVRIVHSELDAWANAVDKDKNAERTIQATVFDTSDGVRSLDDNGGYTPHVARSTDGRLWFLPSDGASIVDPRNLPFNRLLPPVYIQRIIADHKTYDASSDEKVSLDLPALVRDLEIDYTALSLVAPEKVLFKYKLENWDQDWLDVGDRRQALYSNLTPGNYRFRVMACNNSGMWNEAGTFLDFSIAPAYYQTTWFRLSCVAALLVLLAAIYQVRVRQVSQRVRVQLEARLEERERIARDLHDTLLQSVQGLILKFHAITKQMPRDLAAHDALEKALDRADEVVAEGRDRVRNLRADTIPFGGLPVAFEHVAEEFPRGRDATFKTLVEGRIRLLHPVVREEAYCIGREALVNALTHSKAVHVEVEITYEATQFRVRVRDDGRGLDPKILEDGGRSGHWGLQGMRERSERIGGQLKLWSRPAAGTEVELTVPGATAYKTDSSRKSFWLRRTSGGDGDQQ